MKKAYLTFLCYAALIPLHALAQTGLNKGVSSLQANAKPAQGAPKWVTKAPFQHDVFIENMGQFSQAEKSAVGKPIMYYSRKGMLHLYFSKQSVIFRYDSVYSLEDENTKEYGEGEDKDEMEKNLKVKHLFFEMNFKNSNPDVQLEVLDKAKDYFTYGNPNDKPGKSGIKAYGWKKLTYRNIYPGIDIEFYYPDGKGGLEYNVIVHPGADASAVKMQYSSNSKLTLSGNDALISAPFLKLTDHAPSAKTDDLHKVDAAFELHDNTLSFNLGNYDRNKTLTIDPWITTPQFIGEERVYDLDCDIHGNIYIYGGATPYYVEKLTSTGTILWTYTSSFAYTFAPDFSFYGGMTVDGHSGSTFISEGYDGNGGQMRKINTLGVEVAAWSGNSNYQELWRLVYNSCVSQGAIIGGGTTGNSFQTCNFDTTLVTMNPVQTVIVSHLDLAMGALDNIGNCYIMSSASELIKAPLASLNTLTYNVASGYTDFTELGSIYYVYTYGHYAGAGANGFNGLAVNRTAVYGFDGATLRKWNPSNGAQISSASVFATPFQSGGLVVDDCNHLYCGKLDSICQYDTSFNRVTAYAMPDSVYDLIISGGQLVACGPGFVAAANIPNLNPVSATYTAPSTCSACDGTATGMVSCGAGPFTYLWSDGQTTQTATGLCAGSYTVTVEGFNCLQDTAIVNIQGKLGYTAAVVDTNPNCALSKGNVTVYPTGGDSPYTYNWSNGETSQEDTGLSAGNYVCTITDSTGCALNITVTLVNPVTPHITVVPLYDSICSGGNVFLTASGVKTYSWTPNTGLTCYTCANPTASPTVTTTYTITGLDSNGCNAVAYATVKVIPVPKPIVTGKDSICPGYQDTLSVTGGTTYLWNNVSTVTSLIVSPAVTKTFTVVAYNGTCIHDTTFTITVVSTPTAVITYNKDTVCQGDSIQLNGSGGATYKWSNGSTSSSIWVKPDSATTYYLKAYSGTCNDSTKTEVYITPKITAAASIIDSVICPFDTAYLAVTSSGGPATYKWSTSSTSSAIMVTPGVTTTYTVTAYGACDSLKFTKTVTVIPLPVPIITGTSTKCAGAKDTLTVSGGTTYLWNNGSTKTTYNTGDINKDSTIYVTVKNSLGCAVKDSFKITAKPYPTGNLTYPSPCLNYPTTITAHPGGSGPFTYKWNTGGTNDTINITVTDTMNYTCVISNGCPITKNITVIPDAPTMFACCNTTIIIGNDTTITASGVNTYSWTPTTGLNCDTCSTVIATPTVTTTYTVTGTDAQGCTVERVVTITVETPCFNFTVPNVFTPNDGGTLGLNKVFYIKTENLTNWAITIYDRWGKEMFKTSNPLDYWVGTTEGGGNAPDGVYYYIISATCQNNTYKKDGFVQLIR